MCEMLTPLRSFLYYHLRTTSYAIIPATFFCVVNMHQHLFVFIQCVTKFNFFLGAHKGKYLEFQFLKDLLTASSNVSSATSLQKI